MVQPHENENDEEGSSPEFTDDKTVNDRYAGSSSQQLTALRRSSSEVSLELEQEHVLSPRIVEAVTNSTQVVWANCQKSEGLLGRSDVKLQTAIGMPVGVDATGNVWVVVMFSPQNVESSSDAIDYLQYISNSAASTNIPCLLPVVGKAGYGEDSEDDSSMDSNNNCGMKTICNGEANSNNNNQQLSLASIKPHSRPNLTRNLADGVMAQFMSFNIKDGIESSVGLHHSSSPGGTINDLQCAPKDPFGIPMLPTSCEMATHDGQNAFDEASYGVWSTIMNSERHQAGGLAKNSGVRIDSNHNASQRGNMASALAGDQDDMPNVDKIHLIKGRLEEFAHAFLGMSVFDLADAWILDSAQPALGTSNDGETPRKLKCLFSVAATDKNPDINYLRDLSGQTHIDVGDGAVGKAFSSGYPVWNSIRVRGIENSSTEFGTDFRSIFLVESDIRQQQGGGLDQLQNRNSVCSADISQSRMRQTCGCALVLFLTAHRVCSVRSEFCAKGRETLVAWTRQGSYTARVCRAKSLEGRRPSRSGRDGRGRGDAEHVYRQKAHTEYRRRSGQR